MKDWFYWWHLTSLHLKNKSTAPGEIAKHVCYYQNVFSLFYAVVYWYDQGYVLFLSKENGYVLDILK